MTGPNDCPTLVGPGCTADNEPSALIFGTKSSPWEQPGAYRFPAAGLTAAGRLQRGKSMVDNGLRARQSALRLAPQPVAWWANLELTALIAGQATRTSKGAAAGARGH